MPTLLQISIEVNSGSVGRIAEQIGQTAINNGWKSYITYARNHLPSQSKTIKIGDKWDIYWHGLNTRIFDNHCLSSTNATKKLINQIEQIKPDIIHLHHIHGYFLNMEVLFHFLIKYNIPVVWTFHDCWTFTGHCVYYEYIGCEKWKSECFSCEQKTKYPASWFIDRSKENFKLKKSLFTQVNKMVIVPVSKWLEREVQQSFLNKCTINVIQNGINLNSFFPITNLDDIKERFNLSNKQIILGVASTWEHRKGLNDFIQLNNLLDSGFTIILVGLNKSQIKKLPKNMIGIERTENTNELAKLYSLAMVFVNPTSEDTFPTTNLESLACGTPVITYRTGGSIESISPDTGIIVEKGDIKGLYNAINKISLNTKESYSIKCRERAEKNYNMHDRFNEYIQLYNKILKNEI